MKIKYTIVILVKIVTCAAANVFVCSLLGADNVAVSATAGSDYKRTKAADGSFNPETYTFARGGAVKGKEADNSVDNIQFLEVAKKLTGPLAAQNYVPSLDPKKTSLLIMVYWGKTTVPEPVNSSPAVQNALAMGTAAEALEQAVMENTERDMTDKSNASLLGYDKWWNNTVDQKGSPFSFRRGDLLNELEDKRYFVVLMAYDFQILWKTKKHKLLWETRFSMPDRGHEFNKDLIYMATDAAKYFGHNTDGLIHKELPQGVIEEGELKVIDYPNSIPSSSVPTK